jgi:hypothetical protein
MDSMVTRRPMAAPIALVAAAVAIMLAMTTVMPRVAQVAQVASPSAPRVSTQSVVLTANFLEGLTTFAGAGLPAGVSTVAPITEEIVRSAATYTGQLLIGQGWRIPGEISAQAANLGKALSAVQIYIGAIPPSLTSVFGFALLQAFLSFAPMISPNPLQGLPETLHRLSDVVVNFSNLAIFGTVSVLFGSRNTIAAALELPSLPQSATPTAALSVAASAPAAARPEPATASAPVIARPAPVAAIGRFTRGAEQGAASSGLGTLVKSRTPIAMPATKTPASVASSTTVSSEAEAPAPLAVDPTVPPVTKKFPRTAATAGSAGQGKIGSTHRGSHQQTAAKSAS